MMEEHFKKVKSGALVLKVSHTVCLCFELSFEIFLCIRQYFRSGSALFLIDWARFGYTPGPRSGSRSSFTDKYEHLCTSCLLHVCPKIMLNLPSKSKAKLWKNLLLVLGQNLVSISSRFLLRWNADRRSALEPTQIQNTGLEFKKLLSFQGRKEEKEEEAQEARKGGRGRRGGGGEKWGGGEED